MPRKPAPEPRLRGPLPLAAAAADAVVPLDGTPVKLTHLQKPLFPDGLRKRDLLDYNHDVAEFLLPYLRDRPYTMLRYPNGIGAPAFFQKQAGAIPAFVRTVAMPSANARGHIDFVLCNDLPTLLYLVNLGCIDHHVWMSRAAAPLEPDFVLLDLDPGDRAPFAAVVRVAQAIRRVLDACEIAACLKTSGATGMHVWIPLAPGHSFEQSRDVAALILRLAAARVPALATEVWQVGRRPRDRVYLDFRQNAHGKTVPPPYSPRPRPGAPVSCPLHWSELRTSLDPARFTFTAVRRRLDRFGDLFAPLRPDSPREPLASMLARIQRVTERRR
jgi:bifunctional non-homologous end joining protein LigD